MTVEIRKLGDAAGAEILGLDMLVPWDEMTRRTVHQAYLDHLVLVFRDRSEFQWRRSWRLGDMSIWENRAAVHTATLDYA